MDKAFPVVISSLPLGVTLFTRLWEELDTLRSRGIPE